MQHTQRRVLGSIGIAIILGVVFVLPQRANACSCVQPSPVAESLAAADAVFLGTVTNISNPIFPVSSTNGKHIAMTVETSWKGVSTSPLTLKTGLGGGDCGYTFHTGTSYLVYAQRDGTTLAVNVCSRTKPISNALVDLQALGHGAVITTARTSRATVAVATIIGFVELLVVAVAMLQKSKKKYDT